MRWKGCPKVVLMYEGTPNVKNMRKFEGGCRKFYVRVSSIADVLNENKSKRLQDIVFWHPFDPAAIEVLLGQPFWTVSYILFLNLCPC